MLAMPEIHYIKHLRENKELTISEIARKTGNNWRTVKKYADGSVQPKDVQKKKRGMMYEEGYGEIVDDWLEEDAKLRRKERRTAKRIFEQLKNEHGFRGSYRTVCEYVENRRPQIKEQQVERHERLEHPPGEAQVDFGNMTVVHSGAYKDIKALILSFPHSNAGFIYPLPAENSECFLEGLKQLFQQAGGVPTYLRMDNLSAAVVSIGRGDQRTYTEDFLRFQMHYGFEAQPCNPGKGNEKGNVERKVCYTRNNWFVTAPVMEDFAGLTAWLQEQMIADRQRLHYDKKVLIDQLWQEDQKHLKPLPLEALSVFSIDTAAINKYGEITVDQTRFVIRKTVTKQHLIVKKEWDQFTCLTNDGEVVYQDYRPYMHVKRDIPWKEIFTDWEGKPRSMRYSRFFPYLPERVQAYLLFKKEDMRKRISGMRQLIGDVSFEQLQELLQQEEWLEREPHELKFLLKAKNASYPEKWGETYTPSVLVNYETDLGQYDRVLCPSLEGGSQS
ncbi:IS21 family transposase [Ectobacillus ponti]|uniref:IS21 family transposase n=1 Tax=Ectobacillus ponti TaxID=2961894 RepID=A0AA42BRV5_9BACI|nr:IS21 family transposase [Ectobacillus ponti]MCP8971382.1 IS21 family transposase [Ectobacillus ponti]